MLPQTKLQPEEKEEGRGAEIHSTFGTWHLEEMRPSGSTHCESVGEM